MDGEPASRSQRGRPPAGHQADYIWRSSVGAAEQHNEELNLRRPGPRTLDAFRTLRTDTSAVQSEIICPIKYTYPPTQKQQQQQQRPSCFDTTYIGINNTVLRTRECKSRKATIAVLTRPANVFEYTQVDESG